MTAIINETATTSWTGWVRGKAVTLVNRMARTRNAVANAPGLERDVRVHAAALEREQRYSRLSAGSYIRSID